MAGTGDNSADILPRAAYSAILASVILGSLYYGRDILIPVVLAVLLSFVLSPLVNFLKVRVPRGLAVAMVVAATLLSVLMLGFALAHQVIELGNELPRYESTLREKLKSFRTGSAQTSVIDRATSVLKELSQELEQPKATTADGSKREEQQKPIPVEIRQPPDRPLDIYQRILTALLGPVTTTAIVLIMVVFILLQKNDIRDRVIRLAGPRDIQLTTAALDDAAARLSRLFLMQTALNTAFGVAVASGLWLIGVPSPILWGVFAALMRFVPYIGSILSAIFPLLLAASVDPGWSMAIETAALFLVLEPLTGNFLEPWLQGHSTGLSPLAIVVAAVLWTTLWGPIGLLIATPITMCLVVLGRHMDSLSFLNVILGDEPALSPQESFYQRLLSGSSVEAVEHAQAFLKTGSLLAYADEVVLPGLELAAKDASRGAIDDAKMEEVYDGVMLLLDDLSDRPLDLKAPSAADGSSEHDPLQSSQRSPSTIGELLRPQVAAQLSSEGTAVLCIGARRPVDAAAAELLASLLNRIGVPSRAAAVNRLVELNNLDLEKVRFVWLTSTNIEAEQSHARYVLRRLHRMAPALTVCGAFWGTPGSGGRDIELVPGLAKIARNLHEAMQFTVELVSELPDREPTGLVGERSKTGDLSVVRATH